MALKKYCSRCGCNKLIPAGDRYCKQHTTTEKERNAEYDRTRRDKKAKAFYNSKEWIIARQKALTRDNGIDIYLFMTEQRIVPAAVVHHITELREDYTKRCDIDNLISVSEATHEGVIKQMYSNPETKKEMQKALRKALADYKQMVGGR